MLLLDEIHRMWGQEKAVRMLRRAGFSDVAVEEMAGDPFNLHFCCRKKASCPGNRR